MGIIIEEELGGKISTVEICKNKGMREFDPFFLSEIENLGEGASGSVSKWIDLSNRMMLGVKTVSLESKSEEDYLRKSMGS